METGEVPERKRQAEKGSSVGWLNLEQEDRDGGILIRPFRCR
jgi:hypothetical protein